MYIVVARQAGLSMQPQVSCMHIKQRYTQANKPNISVTTSYAWKIQCY